MRIENRTVCVRQSPLSLTCEQYNELQERTRYTGLSTTGVTATPVFPGDAKCVGVPRSLQTQPTRGGRSSILRHRRVATKRDHTWWEREGAEPAPTPLTNGTEGGSHRVSPNRRDDPNTLGRSHARVRLHHRSLGGHWAGPTVWSGAERQTQTQSRRRWRRLLWWQRRSPRNRWARTARPRCTGSAKD